MEFGIVNGTDKEITIQDAIENNYIIGFICRADNTKQLIIRINKDEWMKIHHKNVNILSEYYYSNVDTLKNITDSLLYKNKEVYSSGGKTRKAEYDIVKAFDNYEDAFKWYLI